MFLMEASREAKIGELDMTVRIHEDVVWLDVPIVELVCVEIIFISKSSPRIPNNKFKPRHRH